MTNEIKRYRYDGHWDVLRNPPNPSKEEVEAAKIDAKDNIALNIMEARCSICFKVYSVPSEINNILDNGVCGWCNYYINHKTDYITSTETPTIEDAMSRLNAPENRYKSICREEVLIFTNAYEELKKRIENLEKTFLHTHVNNHDETDRCKRCGLDLRDNVHEVPPPQGWGILSS